MDLKKFRFAHKLSQSDLAELWGVKQAHVSSIEKGERNKITPLQVRLLIERFGYDDVAKYASPGEMPERQQPNVSISGNTGPVIQGNGNTITTDAKLIDVVQQQTAQISTLLEHQNRLISIIEKMQNHGTSE